MKPLTVVSLPIGILLTGTLLSLAMVSAAGGSEPVAESPITRADSNGPPPITIHGFGDVNYRADWTDSTQGGNSTSGAFALGQVDLFLVSNLSDHLSFLSEIVFKLSASGQQVVEVERVFIKYSFSDFLRVAAGRTHTALGYWNEAYHHGALLHTTVQRPEILKFGGIMPLHSVGLEVSGLAAAGAWEAAYVANISNGRGSRFSATQGHTDANQGKGKAFKLTVAFDHPSLRVAAGPVLYIDTIPADATKEGRHHDVDEWITGAHLIVGRGTFDLIAEHFWIRHENTGTSRRLQHDGGYILTSLRAGVWTPYLGFDRMDFEPGDAVFSGSDVDLQRFLAGVRYDLNHAAALKLEYRIEDRDAFSANVLVVQAAFGF